MIECELISSTNTAKLEREVTGWISKGWDLFGGIIPNEDAVGQWIACVQSDHEYRMIEAVTFGELARQCKSLRADRFEMYMGTVYWNGRLLQWMQREIERPIRVVTSSTTAFQVVEHAQPVVKLIPLIA